MAMSERRFGEVECIVVGDAGIGIKPGDRVGTREGMFSVTQVLEGGAVFVRTGQIELTKGEKTSLGGVYVPGAKVWYQRSLPD